MHGYKSPTKKGEQAVALPLRIVVARLAQEGNPLRQDRLEGFEQMRGKPPMLVELDAIEKALLLPDDYFDDKITPRSLGETLEQLGDDLVLADAEGASGTVGSEADNGPPDQVRGGGGG